jgi:hypothetical protein
VGAKLLKAQLFLKPAFKRGGWTFWFCHVFALLGSFGRNFDWFGDASFFPSVTTSLRFPFDMAKAMS